MTVTNRAKDEKDETISAIEESIMKNSTLSDEYKENLIACVEKYMVSSVYEIAYKWNLDLDTYTDVTYVHAYSIVDAESIFRQMHNCSRIMCIKKVD